jgi:PTS system ascorbate-specific IIB component
MYERPLICYTVCGNGTGTSLILKMTLDDVFSDAGIRADVTPMDLTSATGLNCDLIFTSDGLYNEVLAANPGTKVLEVFDFLDRDALTEIAVPAAREILAEEG